MTATLAISRGIDAVTGWVARQVSWLLLVSVLVSAGNAIVRKAFSLSSNAFLEIQWHLFGAVFMLAAAAALQQDKHVRVDLIFGSLSARAKAWVNLAGHVFFLLPFCVVMINLSVPWFLRSFRLMEHSESPGGLVLWPAKLWVVVGLSLLFAQAISEIIKIIGQLRGNLPLPGSETDAEGYR